MTTQLITRLESLSGPRRIYPDWVKQPYSDNAHNLAETLGRIGDRVDAGTTLELEKQAALEWCRANGSPQSKEPLIMDSKQALQYIGAFLLPWAFGCLFQLVVYLETPNPLDWDMFSRGMALCLSFAFVGTGAFWNWIGDL